MFGFFGLGFAFCFSFFFLWLFCFPLQRRSRWAAGFRKGNPHHHQGPALGLSHDPIRMKPKRWAREVPKCSARGGPDPRQNSKGLPEAPAGQSFGVTIQPQAQARRGAPRSPRPRRPPAPPARSRPGAPGAAVGGGAPRDPRGDAGVEARGREERLTVADARLLSASVRWCGSQRLRNFEVRILLRKVRGCRMTQTWMSPSCSNLYLIPLHSRRARRQGTAPIFVPSGAGTSPPSSGLVSSICRGSPPPPELLVRSMAGGAGGGERGCPGCRAAGPPFGSPHPPTAQEGGGVWGWGRPQGRGRGRAAGAAGARSFLRGSASS